MRTFSFVTMTALALGAAFTSKSAMASSLGKHEVHGVSEDDMLKLRAGPGTGYSVIVGLPNGTVLRVHSCERTGATRWCKVSLDRARGLKGYVSWAYLRKI